MRGETEAALERGDAALRRGDWGEAAAAFQDAWDREPTPEAAMGLGTAAWWQGQTQYGLERIREATEVFLARPDLFEAARGMLRVAFHQAESLGRPELAEPWLTQAEALIEAHGIDALRGELRLTRSIVALDLTEAERLAGWASERGREAGDPDLELAALARLGALQVCHGHTREGLESLHQALTTCLGGEPRRAETLAVASALMVRAAVRAADHARALQWVRWLEHFAEQHRSPIHHAVATSAYGAVLVATGAWERAEEVLVEAVSITRDLVPVYFGEATVALAELRLAQGRVEEAERLLHGLDAQVGAHAALARTRLLQGRAQTAVAIVERRLLAIGRARLESGALLEILGEAEFALGTFDAAARHARALLELGQSRSCPTLHARGARLLGRATQHRNLAAALPLFEQSLEAWRRLGMPHEEARTQLQLGVALAEARSPAAEELLWAALRTLDGLGASAEADQAAAALAGLGVVVDPEGRRSRVGLTQREEEVLGLLGEGLSNAELAGRLFLSQRTADHHVASVIAKLGVKSRAEAAAMAERYAEAAAATGGRTAARSRE